MAIAAAGVAVLAAGALDTLWISLTLCFSFATYGLLRKQVAVDSLSGLTVETMMLAPFALAYLAFEASQGAAVFGATDAHAVLLLAAGVISTIPLLLFTEAARRLPYATVGMLQFIAPTVQFLLAVLVYGEAVTTAHAIAFAAIWTAVALYMSGMIAAGAASEAERHTSRTPSIAHRSATTAGGTSPSTDTSATASPPAARRPRLKVAMLIPASPSVGAELADEARARRC